MSTYSGKWTGHCASETAEYYFLCARKHHSRDTFRLIKLSGAGRASGTVAEFHPYALSTLSHSVTDTKSPQFDIKTLAREAQHFCSRRTIVTSQLKRSLYA